MSQQNKSLIFFSFSIGLYPLYLLPSGLPQLTHIFATIAVLLYLDNIVKEVYNLTITKILLAFYFYVFMRQIHYSLSNDIFDFLIFSPFVFLIVNILIFLFVITIIKKTDKIVFLKYSIIISLCIPLVVILYNEILLILDSTFLTTIRATGTFNNPNQLGYFAICLSGIVSLLYLSKYINRLLFLLIYFICIFFSIVSLSKAAIIAILFYLIILVNKEDYKILFLLFVISLTIIITNLDSIDNFRFISRILSIGSDNDDNLEGRGYVVLLNPDFRILFGYGEGFMSKNYERPSFLVNSPGEVHSTLGGVLINYGIMGFILFVLFLLIIFKVSIKKFGFLNSFALFSPFMIYGLTHNGIRFTIFWIFLALIYSINKDIINEDNNIEKTMKKCS